MKKRVLFIIMFIFCSLGFAESFVETKVIFKNHDDESIRKVLLLNKRFLDVVVEGKTFYPVEVKYIVVDEGPDCIVEQITYSDVQAPLSIKYDL